MQIPPIPIRVHITPPKRVDQIYSSEGSVASFDFHLSVISQNILGLINTNAPKNISKIVRISNEISPFFWTFIIFPIAINFTEQPNKHKAILIIMPQTVM